MGTIHDEVDVAISDAHTSVETWSVLIVDGDPVVHETTVALLADTTILDRAVRFIHAYGSAQAIELLRTHDDVAAVLLDVAIGESGSATNPAGGLELARAIRDELHRRELRIVLRSDDPGYSPPIEAIRDLDISDCKTRSRLSRGGLYATLACAVRGYVQIRAFDVGRRGISQIVRASARMLTQPRLRDFAATIVSEIAGLLQCAPEGFVCAHATLEDQGQADEPLRLIAATGRFAPYLDAPASALGNPAISAALAQACGERRSVFAPGASVLYFCGESGNDLAAYIDTTRPLDEVNQRLLEVFVANISSNLNNVELFERLHAQAYLDPLLHIPNRLAFMHAVGGALDAREQTACVAIVDVDHFSHLNDALGYRYGDILLKAVAQRLNDALPPGSVVARLAGDHFGVLGDGQSVTPQALQVAFAETFNVEGTEQRLSATIGLARLSEIDGNASDVIKSANIALSLAKRHRRGEGVYFVRRMEQETRARMRLLRELRAAFDQRWLQVDYQPQVCLRTQRLTGVEALLRWRSGDGESVPPGQFIALAESSGLIVALGKWVLRTACEDLQSLLAQSAELCLSVNVSVVQFRHPGFLDGVDEVLRESGIDPRRLELEITESVAMLDAGYMQGTLSRIKKRGIAIAIDDFGTGFSSLSCLERLAVDRLKIDQSFVTRMLLSESSLRIVETVVQLARSLCLQVIAEGVEEQEQADTLRRIGCDAGQGYLFGRPMGLAQLRARLAPMPDDATPRDGLSAAAAGAQASPR